MLKFSGTIQYTCTSCSESADSRSIQRTCELQPTFARGPLMKKSYLILVCVLFVSLLASSGCSRNTPQDSCDSLRKITNDINKQAPIRLDYVTTATGASAIYGGGICTVTFSKIIDEKVFIDSILTAQHGSSTSSMAAQQRINVINWLNSPEGQEYFQQAFNQVLPDAARTMPRGPGIEAYHLITFDRGGVHPLRIKVNLR